MTPAPWPPDEAARLAALRALLILDTPPEERFDRILQFAVSELDMPMAMLSLVDADRAWFKSRIGLDVAAAPRDISFCGHAIAATELFVVPDMLDDERFADNPLVAEAPRIRFYAGAPLRLAGGHCVGTLCVLDAQPRELDAVERAVLRALRDLAVEQLEREAVPE